MTRFLSAEGIKPLYDAKNRKKALNMNDIRQLDSFDQAILSALSDNARIPVTALAKQVGLSKTPCQNRLKRLVDEGFITGFRAVLSPQKLQREHVAFVEIKLSDTREQALTAFNTAVMKLTEVEQCYMIAGKFDYLLKVRTRDIQEYRSTLGERISSLPYVSNTSTHVAMQAVKETPL